MKPNKYVQLDARVKKAIDAAIKEINTLYGSPLLQRSLIKQPICGFIPDYVIDRDKKPFVIIEIKSKITPLSENLFMQGLSKWSTYGILTDGTTFKVYGKKSFSRIAYYGDLKSALESICGFEKDTEVLSNYEDSDLVCDFIESAAKYLNSAKRDTIVGMVEKWRKSPDKFFEIENESYVLTNYATKALFNILLGKANSRLCRFVSLRSVFEMLNNGRFYLNNIMNMNDKTEGSYFDNYSSKNNQSEGLLNKIEYFILSCSDITKSDDFDMWRLYGDGAKGCCLEFQLSEKSFSDFKIFPVSYGNKDNRHPEVDFLCYLVSNEFAGKKKIVIRDLNEWKLFFKPYEYHNEEEIRIVQCSEQCGDKYDEEYFINEHYGMVSKKLSYNFCEFPLTLVSVILGPCLPEKDASRVILEELSKRQTKGQVVIFDSKYDSYRS